LLALLATEGPAVLAAAIAGKAAELVAVLRLYAEIAARACRLPAAELGRRVAAFDAGIAALADLHVGPAAHAAIFVHVKWAMLTSTATLLIAVWRGAGQAHDARPSRGLVIAVVLAGAAMAITAYRGDLNVYRYGVAVTRPVEAAR
jgi:hypothetical protein